MCGILGGTSLKIKNEKEISLILESLKHRGPDGSGVFWDKKNRVFLGHQRLSIIDLSDKAKQPMRIITNNPTYVKTSGGRQETITKNKQECVITFNGEIYNYKEIKKELEEKGYKFKSDSDTEVVLNSYLEWGTKCVERFRGMFAFGIWDESKKKMILIRDRFGVKPLYYYFGGDDFIFASELKAICQFPNFHKEINLEVLPLYFHFGYIPDPYTIFKNVFRLEAGMIMEIPLPFNSFNFKKEKYWSPEHYFNKTPINADLYADSCRHNDEKIINDLEKVLKESFQYRMVADVDVGVFLSGGIDSSLVAAILQKNSSKKIKTFTIGFQDEKYNEAPTAREIADYLGTEHQEYYVSTEDLKKAFDNYANIFDEPFGDSSGLPTYLLAKLARQNVKVALSGDGGDELFSGYSKYYAIEKIIKLPIFLRTLMKKIIKIFGPQNITNLYNISCKILPLPRYSNLREKISKLYNLLDGRDLAEMFDLA
ncbi:MAG: asparagine synthase (glutamine-hydrolyzing), partial [Dehalococcoidales bacterium]|nr:asparagine synthase (glutamine-hydrolyzing) [Dehalococcoidales bacterium]